MDQSKKKKLISKLIILLSVLFALSSLMCVLYGISENQVKGSIETNIQPIIEKIKTEKGAKTVDVKICMEPKTHALPWSVEYHVFLTASFDDLRRYSETDLNNLLLDDESKIKRIYRYDNDDYALYAETVEDSVTGKLHPVILTITDGDRSYCLYEPYTTPEVGEGDAYYLIYPMETGGFPSACWAISILLFVSLAALVGLQIKNRIDARKEEKSAELTEIANGVGIDNILKKLDADIAEESASDKKKKTTKLIAISACAVVVIAIVATVVINLIVVPNNKYKEAVALKEAGNIDGGYLIFEELGDYKDCEEQMNEIDYGRAITCMTQNDWKGAYLILSKISGYKDAADVMKQLEVGNPHLSLLLAKQGDIVTFGEYEQDNDLTNGKEPIEWIVLHNEDGDMYLLSKYILDVQQFNTTNSKECTLDDWLKTTFSENAFALVGDEIITRVGIFQEIDIENYELAKEQRVAEYTPYAMSLDPEYWSYDGGYLWWVVEDELFNGMGKISAPVVLEDGRYGNYSCNVIERCGVRPAVWLFADINEIPAEPIYDGSAPAQWRPSGGTETCEYCNGRGKILVTWYSHGDHGEKSYSTYECTYCGGDGKR